VKGFEPSTTGATIQCSAKLSYTHHPVSLARHAARAARKFRVARQKGFEPLTRGLEGRCSFLLSYWRYRGEPIRTADPLLPRQVRYQAAPRPEFLGINTRTGASQRPP
jgi:hypothetical protein